MLVKIFSHSSIRSIRRSEGQAIFILTTQIGDKEATLSKKISFKKDPKEGEYEEATDKLSNLIVNLSAIRRLTNKCDALEIYTDSTYFSSAFEQGWIEKWKKSEWKNAQGEEIAHAKYWQEIDAKLSELNIKPIIHIKEHHPYSNWLEREAEKET